MEYIDENGTKIIVAGNKVQYGEGKMRENVIGANYTHGIRHGGYLSSFNGTFHNELIGIESGIGDIINAKIGNVKEAYEFFGKSSMEEILLTINQKDEGGEGRSDEFIEKYSELMKERVG